LKRGGTTFHRPQSTAWSTVCEGEVSRCMRQMVVTTDIDWISDSRPYLFLTVSVTNRCIMYLYVSISREIHRLGLNEFISIDWLIS
jgi:hypothetical protein